jgi:hypothetical protein
MNYSKFSVFTSTYCRSNKTQLSTKNFEAMQSIASIFNRYSLIHKALLIKLFVFIAISVSGQTVGDYRSNAATMNWTATASWQRWNGTSWVTNPTEGYPGQNTGTGRVQILNGHTVNLNVSPANSIGSLVVGVAPNSTSSLIFNTTGGPFTLNVTGKVDIAGNNNNNLNQLDVTTGTLNVGGDLQIGTGSTANGGNANRRSHLLISTGNINIDGNLIYTVAGGTINSVASIIFSGAGSLNLKGAINFSDNTNGTLTPSTGTVNFNGTTAQTIPIGVAAITYK